MDINKVIKKLYNSITEVYKESKKLIPWSGMSYFLSGEGYFPRNPENEMKGLTYSSTVYESIDDKTKE
jgi:hypothetical protein